MLRKCLFTALQHKLEEILGILINFSNEINVDNVTKIVVMVYCSIETILETFPHHQSGLFVDLLRLNLLNIERLMHDISSLVKIMLRICLLATHQHKFGEICGILIYFSNDIDSWKENHWCGLTLNRNNRRDVTS